MKYLGFEVGELVEKGAIHTAREISQQPVLWRTVYQLVGDRKKDIRSFFDDASSAQRIILTGAGTSAFIGLSLRGIFQRHKKIITEAISTTDLVSHPRDYLQESIPTLLISFARSGNSPESAAVIGIADALCHTCYHLIITCNGDGLLARQDTRSRKYVFTLPEEANDQSLAMTSSYTGMLLAATLMADMHAYEQFAAPVQALAAYGENIIHNVAPDLERLAQLNFSRAVFLGSGPFFGTAIESHLKLQELTDGRVICKHDSYLGFRHGPKAVVDPDTLVVYILSGNAYVRQYEKDLVVAMKKGRLPLAEVAICGTPVEGVALDYNFVVADGPARLSDELLVVCAVVPSQLLAFYKSLHLGLRPDAPSVTGAIARVVEGVQIYALEK